MIIKIHTGEISDMTNIHEFMKNRESSVTSVVDGKTIIDFFNQNADDYPDYPAVNTPINDEYSGWNSTSWSEYREMVHNLASALLILVLVQVRMVLLLVTIQKNTSCLISQLCTGGTPSTIYKQLKSGQIEYIANLLDAKIAFVGNAQLFDEVNAAKNSPNLKYLIMIEDFEDYKDLDYVLSFRI